MKVTDLTLTLFNWSFSPWRTGQTSVDGDIQMGIETIHTDEGVEGHSFLGTFYQGADVFAKLLLGVLKPRVVGRNPAATHWIKAPSGETSTSREGPSPSKP